MAESKDNTETTKSTANADLVKTIDAALRNAEPGRFGSDRKLVYRTENRSGKTVIIYRAISEANFGNELLKKAGLSTKEIRLHEYTVNAKTNS